MKGRPLNRTNIQNNAQQIKIKGKVVPVPPIQKKPSLGSNQRYVEQLKIDHRTSCKQFQRVSNKCLSKIEKDKRGRILVWLLETVQPALDLRFRTIEHTVKMLDIYQASRSNSTPGQMTKKGSSVYPEVKQLKMDIITCLFSCCKYNQIYPPLLSQIYNLGDNQVAQSEIISNEITILSGLDLNLNFVLVEDWYKIFTGNLMPCWAYMCYLDFDLSDKNENIAQQVIKFMKKMEKSQKTQTFKQIIHITDKFVYNHLMKDLYKQFLFFKLNDRISNISFQDIQS